MDIVMYSIIWKTLYALFFQTIKYILNDDVFVLGYCHFKYLKHFKHVLCSYTLTQLFM